MKSTSTFVRRNWRSVLILLTIGVDILAIGLSGRLACIFCDLTPGLDRFTHEVYFRIVVLSGAFFVFIGMVLGLYRGAYHLDNRKQFLLAAKSFLYGVFITLALFYVFRYTDFPRRFIVAFFLLVPLFFVAGRKLLDLLNSAVQRRGFGLRKALIVGYGDGAEEVHARLQAFPELGYDIKGFLTKKKVSSASHVSPKSNLTPVHLLAQVDEVIVQNSIDRIFVPSAQLIANGYSDLVEVCKRHAVKIKVLSPESDDLLRKARVYDIAGISLYSPPRSRVELAKRSLKRIVDFIGALLLLLLLSPIFAATSLAILYESGGPVLFRQKRSSTKGGRTFYFYKFRSMIKNADEMKESLFHKNESDGALFKLKNDPRLTKVGRFIRKYSIDELPQLFNVLKGDMSLVGPRPLPVSDFKKFDAPEEFWTSIKDRDKVKPGMTGLWQISGRSKLGFKEMVLLDLYYVENYSLLFDVEILFATIPVVMFGRGAY